MAAAKTPMSDFLKYDKAKAINSFNAHKGIQGTAKRTFLSRADYLIALRSNTSSQNLKIAQAKYEKCGDIEIAVERLVCINFTNCDEYLKVLEEVSIEREQLDKRVTEVCDEPVLNKC